MPATLLKMNCFTEACNCMKKMNSFTAIFHGFYLDFKNIFPQKNSEWLQSPRYLLCFSVKFKVKPEIGKWLHSHIFFKNFVQDLSNFWGYFPRWHTMLFPCLSNIYMLTSYRCQIDAEMTLFVYSARNPRTPIYQNTFQCWLWYVHSLYLFIL